jgi:hypothetical protein
MHLLGEEIASIRSALVSSKTKDTFGAPIPGICESEIVFTGRRMCSTPHV